MRILFLACDGTIRSPKSNSKFITFPTDQQVIPGATIGIEYCCKLEYTVVGISNQGGVAAGHKTIGEAISEQRFTLELFPGMSAIYFCPDFEGQKAWKITRNSITSPFKNVFGSSYRLPGTGMFQWAIKDIKEEHRGVVNIAECFMVGDRLEAQQSAETLGIGFMQTELWLNCFR